MIELRRFGKNRSFFIIFLDFKMYITLRQINRFFRFLSQIKVLFFYFNRFFVEFLLSLLIACYWPIISDYFSSIFPMLNSHKKMKSSFLKNTMPISYIQHGFCTLYQLKNKKNQLSEVCFNFEFLRFLHHS